MKLELFYPVRPYSINQHFGNNLSCSENKPQLSITERKVVTKDGATCPVGYVELYPLLGLKGHTGEDLTAYTGQPCYYSAPDGVVVEVEGEPERGLGLGILTDEMYEFEGGEYFAKTRYWHLKSFVVKKGDKIKQGDLIAYCDNTGLSSGSHLHFELKPVLKDINGNIYNVFQQNGYVGSVDPEPYWNRFYAPDAIKVGIIRKFIIALQELVSKL